MGAEEGCSSVYTLLHRMNKFWVAAKFMRATFSQCLCRRMQTIVYRRHPTTKMSARVRCSVARRPKEFAGKRAKSRASDYGDLTSASKLFERPCCTLHAIWGRLSQIHCYVRARVQLCTWYIRTLTCVHWKCTFITNKVNLLALGSLPFPPSSVSSFSYLSDL